MHALKERGIPVAGTDRMVLTDQLAVMDLVAVADFTLLPEDDLNTAVVLKGPFIGLGDDQLFDLAYGRQGSLWAALRKRREPLFAAAAEKLADLLSRADTVAPFAFFADLLGRGQGRADLLARLGSEANDPIDEFLSLALAYQRDQTPSMQGFLHWLAAGQAQVKRDLEHGRGEVRVMTVHGSKGLQADIVFLPDTCTLPPARLDPRLKWRRGEDPVMLWPVRKEGEDALCGQLAEDVRRDRDREYRRLLYVAMTRARDRLYVCGWEGKRGRDDGCWYDLVRDSIAATAAPEPLEFGDTGWRLSAPQEENPDGLEQAPAGATAAADPPPWTMLPPAAEPAPAKPLTPSRPDEDEPPVRSPLGDDGGRRFKRGLLIHRLLQSLPDLAPVSRPGAAAAFLARPAHGLNATERAEIARETLAVLDHPDFAPLFGPNSRAEVPLVGEVSGQVISAQVDRLAVDGDTLSVVDFKTNRPAPSTQDGVAKIYLRQMAAYREALRRIYPDKTVRCLLLWTDGPALMPISDDLLDAHAP